MDNSGIYLNAVQRYSKMDCNAEVVEGQDIKAASLPVEIQVVNEEKGETTYNFYCPWCSKWYITKSNFDMNIIFTCVLCKEQMMVSKEEEVSKENQVAPAT